MDTILKEKEEYQKIETICKDHEIEIIDHSTEVLDSYITFNYKKNKSFFNKLFLLREKEYVIQFEKKEKLLTLTISGKQELYKDILGILEYKEVISNDINALISFIDKVKTTELNIITYFNGITYFYKISENEYGNALEYYNFSFDGYRYHYQVNSSQGFYEILKKLNKDIEVYKNLTKDIDVILQEKITDKNINIQSIREIYSKKGTKELFIIFKNNLYYIVIKLNNNLYLYQYSNELNIKNMIPDLFNIYLESSNGIYKDDRHSCLGRSFYMNSISPNNKLFIYNIEEEDLDYYIQYLNLLTNKIVKEKEYNKNFIKPEIRLTNKSYGFVNIFILSIWILIFGIFTFIITLSIFRKM